MDDNTIEITGRTEDSAVSIELFGVQRMLAGTDSVSMPITGNTAVRDALQYMRDRYPALPLKGEIVLMAVNQESSSPDRLLKANDTVCFIPYIGGG